MVQPKGSNTANNNAPRTRGQKRKANDDADAGYVPNASQANASQASASEEAPPKKRAKGQKSKQVPTPPDSDPDNQPGPGDEPAKLGGLFKPGRKWEIYFGKEIANVPEGVTDEEVTEFLDNEISTRFPMGSTSYGVLGQWNRNGHAFKEDTVVAVLFAHDNENLSLVELTRDKVREVAWAWQTRFRQDAVLVAELPCSMVFIGNE